MLHSFTVSWLWYCLVLFIQDTDTEPQMGPVMGPMMGPMMGPVMGPVMSPVMGPVMGTMMGPVMSPVMSPISSRHLLTVSSWRECAVYHTVKHLALSRRWLVDRTHTEWHTHAWHTDRRVDILGVSQLCCIELVCVEPAVKTNDIS